MGDHGARQLSPLFNRRLIKWDDRAGEYRVDLDDAFRQVLRELMQQFLDLLGDPGAPVMHRLFPPAYSDPGDLERQEEYRRLMQEDLVERHKAECETVLATADAKHLTEEQLLAWTRSINGLRLAIGTYLDVQEDDPVGEPTTAEESAYHWLSFLLDEAVDALSRHT